MRKREIERERKWELVGHSDKTKRERGKQRMKQRNRDRVIECERVKAR